MTSLQGKAPRESVVEMVQHIKPGDTNALHTVFGGKVMSWIDIAGAVCGMRHARNSVVTASFEAVDFHEPAVVGDIMVLKAKINFAGRTSMEIGVEVLSENPRTGHRVLTTEAILTFVAIDENKKPTQVPPLLPETDIEKRRYKEAQERKKLRAARKKK